MAMFPPLSAIGTLPPSTRTVTSTSRRIVVSVYDNIPAIDSNVESCLGVAPLPVSTIVAHAVMVPMSTSFKASMVRIPMMILSPMSDLQPSHWRTISMNMAHMAAP
tara:strand:- start:103 stop:420 length:318 start_codon:yes stop_codon:yes gene_type:complete